MRQLRAFHHRIGPGWMLVLGFLLMFSAYEGGRVLNTRPAPFHLWRQADCLSLTANYQAGQPFLQPAIHAQIADNGQSGLSAGEFPIIYWAMGQLWKITGQSEFTYRLFGILLHFIATWFFFQTLRRLLQSDFWALTTALLLFTSPVIVYYSVGFLTDVPAFDLVLIGWYFMVRFAQEQRRRWWVWAMVFFAFATLLKVSAGMSLVAIMALLALATLAPKAFGEHRKLLPPVGFAWVTIAIGLVAIMAWYIHAERYNSQHGGRYTFNSIWPIWEMAPDEVERAWTWARQILVFQVFDTTVWIVLAGAFVALAFNVRRIPWPVALLNGLLLIGVTAYTILWFHALDSHDYYYITPMITLLVLWATFLWWLRRDHPHLFHAPWLKVFFSALLLFNVAYAANNMRMRYTVHGPIDREALLPIYHEHEFTLWNAIDYYGVRSALDMEPTLDALGVGKDELVIYLDDISINGSLYLMGRKGFTDYGHDWSDPATFERLVELGAAYLIFAEDRWLEDPVLQPYLERPLGRHRWAYIYDLRQLPERVENDLVLDAKGAAHASIIARVDTIPCTTPNNTMWCLADGEYPMEIDQLPLEGGGVVRSEVSVKLMFHMDDMSDADEVYLIMAEDAADGPVTNIARRLQNGKMDLRWSLLRHPFTVRNKLYLWNRTGRSFTLEDIQVEVRRFIPEQADLPGHEE